MTEALVASVGCCLLLRAAAGPGVALPLGPVVAPVWLFAIAICSLVSLPVASTRLTLAERQCVRHDWRLGAGRAAAFLGTYGSGLVVLAGSRATTSFGLFAAGGAALCLVLAAVFGDEAILLVLAVSLVVIVCSTYPWFTTMLVAIDQVGCGTAIAMGPWAASIAVMAVSHLRARPPRLP